MTESDKVRAIRAWNKAKIKKQKDYEINLVSQDHKRVQQGTIYPVNFGSNLGHEIDKLRPALVVSNEEYNEIPSGIAVVIPLTKNVQIKDDGIPVYRHHFILKKDTFTFLRYDSTLQIDQIRSVSNRRIDTKHPMGTLEEDVLVKIKNKISEFFG